MWLGLNPKNKRQWWKNSGRKEILEGHIKSVVVNKGNIRRKENSGITAEQYRSRSVDFIWEINRWQKWTKDAKQNRGTEKGIEHDSLNGHGKRIQKVYGKIQRKTIDQQEKSRKDIKPLIRRHVGKSQQNGGFTERREQENKRYDEDNNKKVKCGRDRQCGQTNVSRWSRKEAQLVYAQARRRPKNNPG